MVRARGIAGHRSKEEKAAHQAQIARLTLQGYNQLDIGEKVGVDRSTVSRDLKLIRGEWALSTERDIASERGQMLAKLRLVQAEGWRAWEESKKVKQIKEVKGGETTITEIIVPGNVQFLQVVFNAIKEEGALLGLYPQKDDKPSVPPPNIDDVDLDKLTFKDLISVARGDKELLRKAV